VRYLRAELLQWYGLFGAALIWAAQLVVGFGVTFADCNVESSRGLDEVTWQIVLLVIALLFAIAAEAAAVAVFLSTRRHEYDDPAPTGRQHFFAFAAMLGNLIFLTVIVLTGVGAIANAPCHQS
jgi:putative copper export protein